MEEGGRRNIRRHPRRAHLAVKDPLLSWRPSQKRNTVGRVRRLLLNTCVTLQASKIRVIKKHWRCTTGEEDRAKRVQVIRAQVRINVRGREMLEVKPRHQMLCRKDNSQVLLHRLDHACRGVYSRGHDGIQIMNRAGEEIETMTALVYSFFLHGCQNEVCR